MKLLHVIRTLDPDWGGPVEVIKNLAAAGTQNGISTEVLCSDQPDAPFLRSWSIPVHTAGPAKFNFGYSSALDRWLAQNLKCYDAVVVHSIWMYFSYSVWKASKTLHVPYYLYIHGALDPWFKAYYPVKHLKKVIYWRLFEHKVVRDAAAVLFASAEEEALAVNAFQPYRCESAVVGYGTFLPDAANREAARHHVIRELTELYPQLEYRRYLLYLARIHEKKGLDSLLKAFSAAQRLYPDHSLLVAGPGNERLVNSLKELSRSLGISSKTVWTGPLYGEVKWQAIKGADAYVLPSHQENFGISVTEALACNTPVLISNRVNIWREIDQSGAGIVDDDNDAGTIRLLERWSALGESGQEAMRRRAKPCFLRHFDVATNSCKFFDLIRWPQVSGH